MLYKVAWIVKYAEVTYLTAGGQSE